MNDKINQVEIPVKPERCPDKHKRAYKTAFGQLFCPSCGHNIKEFIRPAKLPRGAYDKDLEEVVGSYKK